MKIVITILLMFTSGLLYGQFGDYLFTKGTFMQRDSVGELREVSKMDSVLEVSVILRQNILILKYYEYGTVKFAGGAEFNISDTWSAKVNNDYVIYSQDLGELFFCFLYYPEHKNILQFMIGNSNTNQLIFFAP